MDLNRTIQLLKDLSKQCRNQDLTIAEFVDLLEDQQGHALVIVCLTLPFLSPVPLPGVSLLLGIIVAFVSLGLIFQRDLWIPSILARLVLPKKITSLLLMTTSKGLELLEKYFRPRLQIVAHHSIAISLCGTLIFLSGLILALPLPPGTNAPPALVCMLLALGLLAGDGLFILLGCLLFFLQFFIIWEVTHFIWSLIISTVH